MPDDTEMLIVVDCGACEVGDAVDGDVVPVEIDVPLAAEIAEPAPLWPPTMAQLAVTIADIEGRPALLSNIARVRLERIFAGLPGQPSLEPLPPGQHGRLEALVRWVEETQGRGDRALNRRLLAVLGRHPSAPVALPA